MCLNVYMQAMIGCVYGTDRCICEDDSSADVFWEKEEQA